MEAVKNERHDIVGHLIALVTIVIWGSTFVSTKLLLVSFTPIEILLFRFIIGFVVLCLIYPKRLRLNKRKDELLFIGAGLCGITFYYLLENIALTYTTASNVGVITSVSPFFIALLSRIFLKSEKPGLQFYLGFVIALGGIFLISFNGSAMGLNPRGDILAFLATIVWACYSILGRKISALGFHTVQTTRRTFAYGILFMIPAAFLMDFQLGPSRFLQPVNLGNFLFLGLGASALCFVTWNMAVRRIGAVKTGVYIYLVPVISVTFSMLVLGETLSTLSAVGIGLTLMGLILSEWNFSRKREAVPAKEKAV